MTDPFEKLEAEMKAMPLKGVSAETEKRVLQQLRDRRGAGTGMGRRWILWCLILTVGLAGLIYNWWPSSASKPAEVQSPGPAVTLASGWRIQPTAHPEYHVAGSSRITLQAGELLIEPAVGQDLRRPSEPLMVETPAGTATSSDGRFLVAVCGSVPEKLVVAKGRAAKSFSRVLVLAGSVSFGNPQGDVDGKPDDLLSAEFNQAPVNYPIAIRHEFAFDLYARLAEPVKNNLLFSPYSLAGALAMTAEGARGATAREMEDLLRLPEAGRRIGPEPQRIPWNVALIQAGVVAFNNRVSKTANPALVEEIASVRQELETNRAQEEKLRHEAQESGAASRKVDEYYAAAKKSQELGERLNALLSQVDRYELRVANALWGEETLPFKPSYARSIHPAYRWGDLFAADFQRNREATRQRINRWLEERIGHRLSETVPAGVLNDQSRLVLVDAASFQGEWAEPFPVSETREEDFLLAGGAKLRLPMMHRDSMRLTRFGRFDATGSLMTEEASGLSPADQGFSMLELPYKGDDLTLVLMLPQAPEGLAALEKLLNSQNLQRWIGLLQKRELQVALPRFKLERVQSLDGTLKAMGLVEAFDSRRADFSGVGNPGDFRLSLVQQNVRLNVTESGAESGPAAGVVEAPASKLEPDSSIPAFRVNKPFLFLIRDKKTGNLLLMGRLIQPEGK